jgi:hypothetical protein
VKRGIEFLLALAWLALSGACHVAGAANVALTVRAGAPATIEVRADGTDLRYRWLKDGLPLTRESDAFLDFPAVTPQDQGVYTPIVYNAAGTLVAPTATLTVN